MSHEADAVALDALDGIIEVGGIVQILQLGQWQLLEVDWDTCGLIFSVIFFEKKIWKKIQTLKTVLTEAINSGPTPSPGIMVTTLFEAARVAVERLRDNMSEKHLVRDLG